MGTVILVLFALLALASANGCESIGGDGNFDFGTSDGTNANASDGLATCDGVVVIDVASEPVRVPADTDLVSSASTTCGMSVGVGDQDAVAVLQGALAQCNGQAVAIDGEYGSQTAGAVMEVQRQAGVAADGEYGPATLQAMRWPTTATSGATGCVAGVSQVGTVDEASSPLPPTS